jgi:hypothetical protein
LPEVCPALHRDYTGKITYPRLWSFAISGRFPVSRVGRHYYVAPEHLPVVAEVMGLSPRVAEAA